MNEALMKIIKKVLLIPRVKRGFEKIGQIYETAGLENIDRLGTGAGFEFYEIIRAGSTEPGNREQLDIKESFNERDAKALEKVVQMVLKERMMIVEVGSWKGFSTAVLANNVADYHGSVFAVDHWLGSERVPHHEFAKAVDVYSIFKRNMIALGIWDIVHPLVMDSQTASQIFADEILDLVFIDADHRYEYVKKDISSWLSKLRDDGILCGHDCEGYYSEYSQEDKKMVEGHLEDDYLITVNDYTPAVDEYVHNICHPGIVKALHDCFQKRYSIMPDSTIWYYVK